MGRASAAAPHHTQHDLPRRSPATARRRTALPTSLLSACTDDTMDNTTEVLEAFISKNHARASFGLPALSRAEFDEVQEKVSRLSDTGMQNIIDHFVRDTEWVGAGRVASPSISSKKLIRRLVPLSLHPHFVSPSHEGHDTTGSESSELSRNCEDPKTDATSGSPNYAATRSAPGANTNAGHRRLIVSRPLPRD